MKPGPWLVVTPVVLLLLVISLTARVNCVNATSINVTSKQNSTTRQNASRVELPLQRGPTKDKLGMQVCENLAKITNRKSGFKPIHTTNDTNPAYSNELACAIEPGYRCFPTSDAEYESLKNFYQDGYEIPPPFTPDLKENFCMSGKCNSTTQTCTECMDGAKIIKCPFFSPQRTSDGFRPRAPATWLLMMLLFLAPILVTSLDIQSCWRN